MVVDGAMQAVRASERASDAFALPPLGPSVGRSVGAGKSGDRVTHMQPPTGTARPSDYSTVPYTKKETDRRDVDDAGAVRTARAPAERR